MYSYRSYFVETMFYIYSVFFIHTYFIEHIFLYSYFVGGWAHVLEHRRGGADPHEQLQPHLARHMHMYVYIYIYIYAYTHMLYNSTTILLLTIQAIIVIYKSSRVMLFVPIVVDT